MGGNKKKNTRPLICDGLKQLSPLQKCRLLYRFLTLVAVGSFLMPALTAQVYSINNNSSREQKEKVLSHSGKSKILHGCTLLPDFVSSGACSSVV